MADIRNRVKTLLADHRLWHLGLALLFMILSVTGIAWMYFETAWGKGLADLFGGFPGHLGVPPHRRPGHAGGLRSAYLLSSRPGRMEKIPAFAAGARDTWSSSG